MTLKNIFFFLVNFEFKNTYTTLYRYLSSGFFGSKKHKLIRFRRYATTAVANNYQ